MTVFYYTGVRPKVLPVLIEENTLPKEEPVAKEGELKKEDDGLLQPKPLYNESMSSSQGNITALFPPPPPSPSSSAATGNHNASLDQKSQQSISVQTSIIPSFSQITNPTPTQQTSSFSSATLPPPGSTGEGSGDVNVTKSLQKILKGYDVV